MIRYSVCAIFTLCLGLSLYDNYTALDMNLRRADEAFEAAFRPEVSVAILSSTRQVKYDLYNSLIIVSYDDLLCLTVLL